MSPGVSWSVPGSAVIVRRYTGLQLPGKGYPSTPGRSQLWTQQPPTTKTTTPRKKPPRLAAEPRRSAGLLWCRQQLPDAGAPVRPGARRGVSVPVAWRTNRARLGAGSLGRAPSGSAAPCPWGRGGPTPGRGCPGLRGTPGRLWCRGPPRGTRPARHWRPGRRRAAVGLCSCLRLLWCRRPGGVFGGVRAALGYRGRSPVPAPGRRAALGSGVGGWVRPPSGCGLACGGLVAAGGLVATACGVLVVLPRSSCARLGRSVAAPPPVWSGGWVWWWSVAGRRGAPPWGALLAPRGGGCRRGCCCSWWPLPSVAAHPARRVGQAPARVQALRARPTPGGGEAQPSRNVL